MAGELPEAVARMPSNAVVAEKVAAAALDVTPQQHQHEPPLSRTPEVILDNDELMDLFGAPAVSMANLPS